MAQRRLGRLVGRGLAAPRHLDAQTDVRRVRPAVIWRAYALAPARRTTAQARDFTAGESS